MTPGHLQTAVKSRQLQRIVAETGKAAAGFRLPGPAIHGSGTSLETVLATRRYLAGLYDPNAGHLHALNSRWG